MTWRPTPQPPCPCATCVTALPRTPFDEVGGVGSTSRGIQTDERHCGPDDPCGYCDVGDWIERTDPSPVEEPPEPAHAGPISRIRNATRRNT